MRLEELQRPIGEIFTDDTFKAFVYDFYQTLPDIDDIPAIGDIYRHILSDENIYREFMQYCKKNNFSFTEIDNGISPTLAIHLGVFQSLRTVVIDKIQGLLHTPQEEFYHGMNETLLDEVGGGNMWDALQASIYVGIPVNSYGEVIYMISKTENGYQVYSYESGVHEVDVSGEVTHDWQIESAKQAAKKERNENRDARTVVLKTIQKFQRFQILMDAHTIEDENDIRLATVMIQTFEKETGECWQKTVGDIREENVYRQRLNSYVFFKLLDLEKEFRRLQDEDTSSQKGVILVGGTDLGD